jgi:WD40 repeat protein
LTATVALLLIAAAAGGVIAASWFRQTAAEADTARQDAVGALGREEAERKKVETAGANEQAERRRAEGLAAKNQRSLYATGINLAHQLIEKGDAVRALEVLNGLQPQPAEEDLRGFDWYYLWRQCHTNRLNLTLPGRPVLALAYSPDGNLLAVGTGLIRGRGEKIRIPVLTGQLILWDTRTWKEVATREMPGGPVVAIAFGPDGKTLATVVSELKRDDRWRPRLPEVKLWDVPTLEERVAFHGLTAPKINSLAFSSDGRLLAAAAKEERGGCSKVWEVATGKLRMTCASPRLEDVAFAPNGETLAAVSGDNLVKVWDVTTGEVECLLQHGAPVVCLAFAPDGNSLVTATSRAKGSKLVRLTLWNLATRSSSASVEHSEFVSRLAFAPDGKTLVAAEGFQHLPGRVRIRDAATLAERGSLVGHPEGIRALAFAGDSTTLATGGFLPVPAGKTEWSVGGVVKIWDLTTSQGPVVLRDTGGTIDLGPGGTASFSGPQPISFLALHPDGRLAVTGSHGSCFATVWDAATAKKRTYLARRRDGKPRHVELPRSPYDFTGIALSHDGKTLALGCEDGALDLWDVATLRERITFQAHATSVSKVAFSPDDQVLASAGWGKDSLIKLWDVATGRERAVLEGSAAPHQNVGFSPDGKILATGSPEITVKLWDVATGKQTAALAGHRQSLHRLEFSPDGQTLASSGWDGEVRLWDLATMQERAVLKADSELPIGMTFSSDGKSLATAGERDGTVRLWDVATAKERVRIKAPAGQRFEALVFSPDGRTLAGGSWDPHLAGEHQCELILWDPVTGQERAAFRLLGSRIEPLAFSHDSRVLVAGSGNAVLVLRGATPDEAATWKHVEMPPAPGGIREDADSEQPVSPADVLKDKDGRVRLLAARMLWETGKHRDAVPTLAQVVRDKDRETCLEAAAALAHLGPPAKDAMPALTDALQDPDALGPVR